MSRNFSVRTLVCHDREVSGRTDPKETTRQQNSDTAGRYLRRGLSGTVYDGSEIVYDHIESFTEDDSLLTDVAEALRGVLPAPSWLSTPIRPPIASASSRGTARTRTAP